MKLAFHIWTLAIATAALWAEPAKTDDTKAKPAPADWGAIFKIHWQNRVRAHQEQNLAWKNVVLLGDSITEGFDVEKHFPGRRVLNRGIGADVIGNAMPENDPRGVLQRLDSSVFDCAATDVFILIGINDLNSGRKVETMVEGYRELLSKLRQNVPRLRVHVQSVLPTRGDHDKQNEQVVRFNEHLKKMAAEFGHDYIDLHALMRDSEGKLKAEFTNDGLHINDAAYVLWKKEILRTLDWQ